MLQGEMSFQGEMSHLIFLTKKVGRNQNQGETLQGEMSHKISPYFSKSQLE